MNNLNVVALNYANYQEDKVCKIAKDLYLAGTFNHEIIVFVADQDGCIYPKTAPDYEKYALIRFIKGCFAYSKFSVETCQKVHDFFKSQTIFYNPISECSHRRGFSNTRSTLSHFSNNLIVNEQLEMFSKLDRDIYNHAFAQLDWEREQRETHEACLYSYI
jgi:hypothetical protein